MDDKNTTAGDSEALSPAEMAYFLSGGEDTSGLDGGTQQELPLDGAKDEAKGAAGADPDAETADAEIAADSQARDKNGRFVPHEAMHRERERRKSVETENQALREKMARAEERLSVLNELMQPAANDKTAKGADKDADPFKEAPIDPDEDIFGAFKQMQRQNAALLQRMMAGETRAQEQGAASDMKSAYLADAQAFVAKEPAFRDAYVYLIGNMHAELEAMGIADKAAREAQIAQQEQAFVAQALAGKRSPSELIFTVAKARGFAPKAATGETNGGNGQLDGVRRGQNATMSLAKAGGKGAEGLTLEALAGMSEDEFIEAASSMSGARLRHVLGG